METAPIKKTGKAAAKVIARRVLGSGMDLVRPSLTVKKADLKAALVEQTRRAEDLEARLYKAEKELMTREAEKARERLLTQQAETNRKIEKELNSIVSKSLGALFSLTLKIVKVLDKVTTKIVTLGEHVSEIRLRRLERYLPINEQAMPPQHVNCRSVATPIE